MGGCSSRPKTADFEGVLGLQEESLQEEVSRKNLQAENAGWDAIERQQEVCELPIQTRAIETKGHDETHDVPALSEKQVIEVSKDETLVLQDNCQHVKHVLQETINESGLEKELLSNPELLKLQMTPEVLVTESSVGPDDSVLIIDFTKESQEDIPLLAAHDAETLDAQHKLLNLSNGNLENEDILTFPNGNSENGEKGIFSDSNTPSLQDAPNVELKPNCPRDRHLELSKNHLCLEGAEVLELQKEPMDSGDCYSKLQEEASKSEMESEHHNTVNESGEQRCDEHVTSQEQDKHSEEGIEDCEASCTDSEAGACEVVRAPSDDVLDRENEKEVLKDFSKPIVEDMITGEACKEAGEDFIMHASNDTKSPVAETSDQESSKEIANTADDHVAIIANAITVISQQVAYEKTKEQEANLNAAASKSAEMAVENVTPQADSHLVNDVHVKESSVESVDTVDGEDELVCGKNCFNGKHLSQSVVGEESSHLKLETSSEDAQEDEPCALSFDLKGQQKSESTSIPNGVTAFQVTATAKKPEAQPVCEMEFTELAFIPAQDIPAPDIDEVLEKLASEFERQERVACATP